MKTSTKNILQSVLASDETITEEQRKEAISLLEDGISVRPTTLSAPLLLGPGKAVALLGVSRTTLWRMTKEGLLHPIVLLNNARYRVEELEELAKKGKAK